MKITILQGAFLPVPPALGGAVEKMWFALSDEFINKGHQVTYISRMYKDFPKQETINGVLHKRVKGFSTPSSGIYLKWLDLLYTIKAQAQIPTDTEIIVTNTFWAPIIIKSKFKQRCFVDVARMPKGQMRFYKKSGKLRANSNVVTEAIKRELPSYLHNKVVMVPNPLPFSVSSMVSYNEKKKVLLYAGRIHPEKGLEILIKAFRNVNFNWRLKIVGPYYVAAGGGGETYLNSLKKLGEGLQIDFVGPVYDMDILNKYYAEASVFVYPSVAEKGETFGLAPLEAMAWGCVPIVSDLACFQDFIVHGSNGLIFDHRDNNSVELLRNSITTLIDNQTYSAELANNAILVKQSHSIPVIGAHFLGEFQKLVSSIK